MQYPVVGPTPGSESHQNSSPQTSPVNSSLRNAVRSLLTSGDAAYFSSSHFVGDLEKHLDDVSKHRGYMSERVPKQVSRLEFSTGNVLATRDVKALQQYREYLTLLDYGKGSRYINGVSVLQNTLRNIQA